MDRSKRSMTNDVTVKRKSKDSVLGYLEEFMKNHEKEAIDMMAQLFDEEVMRKQYDIASRRKEREEGRLEGIAEGIVETGLEVGLSETDIIVKLQNKLDISLSKAQEYFQMFCNK